MAFSPGALSVETTGNNLSAAAPDWLPQGVPQNLGEYRLVRPLGHGGIGMVFEGRHRLLEQRVAVKVLNPRHANEPQFAARFRREMAAFGRVPPHPNVVRAQYAGEEAGILFLVMDYVEGIDLSQLLHQHGALTPPAACAAVRQALAGLDVIYRAGLVHRDLKPANLMLTTDALVKILDLGLARLRQPQGGDELTPSNVMMGTFDYLAPEQAASAHSVDIRADIYSLGCTLYKLIRGTAPFAHLSSAAEKLQAHANTPFPSLGPVAPEALDAVLRRMTAKNPDERFATPVEASEALAPFADAAALAMLATGEANTASWVENAAETPNSIGATSTRARTTQPEPRTQPRSRRFWALVFGLIAAVAVVCVYFSTRPGGTGEPANTDKADKDANTPPEPTPTPPGPPPENPAKPDVLPAGSPLRDLDSLVHFQSHDLLDRPPVEAVWHPAGGLASRTYAPGARFLRVDAHREGLFHLGTLHRPSFTLQVQIRQSAWKGGVGLYFGHRLTTPPDDPGSVFQFVMFVDRAEDNGKQVTCVSRGRGRVTIGKDGKPQVRLSNIIDETVVTPIQEGILSLEVVDRRLTRVRLNGDSELKGLVMTDIAKQFAPSDCDGAVGLLVKATSCVFTEVRLKVTDDR